MQEWIPPPKPHTVQRPMQAVNHPCHASGKMPLLQSVYQNFLTAEFSGACQSLYNLTYQATIPTATAIMVSRKNPNVASKNRLAARANKVKKRAQKESAAGRLHPGVVKSDLKRGARPGLMPTSGPRKPVSAKRQRKLDKKLGYAMKRKTETEGEVEMKGVSALDCITWLQNFN